MYSLTGSTNYHNTKRAVLIFVFLVGVPRLVFGQAHIFAEDSILVSGAAITKYHRLGGLQTTEIYFSQFWRLEVQDQGASMVRFLVKALFLVYKQLSYCILLWQRAEEAGSLMSCIRALIPFMRPPPS